MPPPTHFVAPNGSPTSACTQAAPCTFTRAMAIAATAIVLVFFAVDTVRNAPETFSAIVGIAVLAVVLDLVWKWVRGRGATPSPSLGAAGDS